MSYYYFPALISINNLGSPPQLLATTINSGENALKLILEKAGINKSATVAIPAFVCSSVKNAVQRAGFNYCELDLLPNSFETDYKQLPGKQISAVILVHLYGQVHSQTEWVQQYCLEHGVYLIQDLAQSYGVNTSRLDNSPKVFSFGPGKSTTAAGGAIIQGLDEKNLTGVIQPPKHEWINTLFAKTFLKQRSYGYSLTLADKFVALFCGRFVAKIHRASLLRYEAMTRFQNKAAGNAIEKLVAFKEERNMRFSLLANAVTNKSHLKVLNRPEPGIAFKIVLLAQNQAEFKTFLTGNNIPYYCLIADLNKETIDMPNFNKYANSIFEISTEASIPLAEIKRIAGLLNKF